MDKKSVIIIGGGVAGLSTGSYALANGYAVTILEMNDKPGGLCTAWPKGDYTVDLCLHWLTGATDRGYRMYHDWRFLGVIDQLNYTFPTEFARMVSIDGKNLVLSTNLDELEQSLLACGPEDTQEIKRLMHAIRMLAKYSFGLEIPTTWRATLRQAWPLIRCLPTLARYGKLTLSDLGTRFNNPFLAQAFGNSWDPRLSALVLLLMLAWGSRGIFGYPIGGSGAFANALEKRFLELGGTIQYNARVEKILVDHKRAVGVQLATGEQVFADDVISAADGHETIFKLLAGQFINDDIQKNYRELPIFGPLLFMAFGVNRSFANTPQILSGTTYQIPKTRIADREHEWLQVKIHNQDPTLAPAGKTVVSVILDSDYAFWEQLSPDHAQYVAAKEAAVQAVIEILDKIFPGFAGQVEMREVVTPTTIHNWTGNWRGSYEGWLPTPGTLTLQMKKTLPGLDNFYMVGHWVQPGGGLPSGVITAKEVVRMLCKRDKKRFIG